MPLSPTDVRNRGVETDLPDGGLQAVIDAETAAVVRRHGPYRDTANPLTVVKSGLNRLHIRLRRAIDESEPFTITEYVGGPFRIGYEDVYAFANESVTVLDDTDFRLRDPWTIERISDYTATHRNTGWGEYVKVTYVPVDDTAERNEVVMKLCILSLAYQGVIETRAGDTATTLGMRSSSGGGSPLVYYEEKERLISSLGGAYAQLS